MTVKETNICENGFVNIMRNGVIIRVTRGEDDGKDLIEFIAPYGKNAGYIVASNNSEQKVRFNNLISKYGKYISDPEGIKVI